MKQVSRIDDQRVQYNTLLINGYNAYQNKDLRKALQYYREAQQLYSDTISSPLVKSIMGVIHMQNSNYSEAIECYQAGIKQLKTTQFKKSKSVDLQYEIASISIKLQANLALCYMILGQNKQSIQQVDSCLKLISQSSDENVKNLYQSLVYIFFRFNNFSMMKNADFDNSDSKYDDYSQACFYSTMAINKQLCQNPQQAYNFQKKALQIWSNRKQSGYMLVTAQHLLVLAKQLNLGKKTINQYERLISDLMDSEELEGINQKTLFKGFNEKMKCAKTITNMLIQFQKDELKYRETNQIQLKDWKLATKIRLQKAIREAQSNSKSVQSKTRKQLQLVIGQLKQTLLSLENQDNILILRNLQKSSFVKEAVQSWNGMKSFLVRSSHIYLNHVKKIKNEVFDKLIQQANRSVKQSKQSKLGLSSKNYIPSKNSSITPRNNNYTSSYNFQTMDDRQTFYKPEAISQISNKNNRGQSKDSYVSNYSRQASKQKPYVSGIGGNKVSKISKIGNPNNHVSNYTAYTSLNISQIADPIQRSKKRILKYVHLCEQGQYFIKRNYSSDGGEQKWILLTRTQFRWSTDQSKIAKKGQFQSYPLKDVKGIIYGKQSDTFLKSCNKHLLPWRCFSIVLGKRTFDLCSQSDQDIIVWVPGFSYAIKRANPQNKTMIGYTPGRLLWKKMWLILTYYFIQPPKKKQKRSFYFQRAQAVRRFANYGFKLPNKKK